MATTPDGHPNALHNGLDDETPEQPGTDEAVERTGVEDSPGTDGGTLGTGGTNHMVDRDITS